MATESVATAPKADLGSARAIFGEYPADVLATIECGATALTRLSALFACIESLANEGKRVHSIVELAALGKEVADDKSNFLDYQRESYEDALKKGGLA